jgi:hypothetical protein
VARSVRSARQREARGASVPPTPSGAEVVPSVVPFQQQHSRAPFPSASSLLLLLRRRHRHRHHAEAVLLAHLLRRRLLHRGAHRGPGASMRDGGPGDAQDGKRSGLLRRQPEGERAGAGAGRRHGVERGRSRAAVAGRSGACVRAREGVRGAWVTLLCPAARRGPALAAGGRARPGRCVWRQRRRAAAAHATARRLRTRACVARCCCGSMRSVQHGNCRCSSWRCRRRAPAASCRPRVVCCVVRSRPRARFPVLSRAARAHCTRRN